MLMVDSINIIYFTWINTNRNWKVILYGQMYDLLVSNILENAKLYVILCNENENILNEAKNYIYEVLNNVNRDIITIETTTQNLYEYYGIKKLYDLAKNEPNKLFVYLHGKGMYHWYNNNSNIRSEHEVILTKNTIYPWRDILDVFSKNQHITRIGFIPSHGGWLWFNFFWVRGNYLITCEDPSITNDRYYYESWLSTGKRYDSESYSLYTGNYTKFTAEQAIDIIYNTKVP
jgi:hypothetical protein